MGFIPTPSEAANSRANAGIFSRLGSTFLHNAPYVGPAYNLAGSIAHLIQGTQGQYGPATSPAGWLWSHIFGGGNPTNAPAATAVNPGGQPGNYPTAFPGGPAAGPVPFGGPGFVNQYPTAFGNFGQLPGEIPVGGPVAGFDSKTGAPVYNPRGVIPIGGSDPYAPHIPTTRVQGVPAFASELMQFVRSRNQI